MKVKELREVLDNYSEDAEIFIENYEPFSADAVKAGFDKAVFEILFDENNFEE